MKHDRYREDAGSAVSSVRVIVCQGHGRRTDAGSGSLRSWVNRAINAGSIKDRFFMLIEKELI